MMWQDILAAIAATLFVLIVLAGLVLTILQAAGLLHS